MARAAARRRELEAPPAPTLTRGQKVCRFIERFCRVPEGDLVGQPMRLAPFQRKFVLAVYDNPAGTKRALLSMARKNGKTALIAAILVAHVAGPEARLNSQVISGALSRDQAALVFNLARKMIELSAELSALCRIVPSSKRIVGLARNVDYHALSAEASRAHGLSPALAILDEIGQIRGPTSDFVDAITTSQGAHAQPLLIAISTSAPSDADLFSLWLDDATRSNDSQLVAHEYRAPGDCELDDPEAWRAANPGLGLFRNEADIAAQAREAMRLPAREASFRNLILNQRVALESLFIAPTIWRENGRPPELEALRVGPSCLALDLSARADLTAAVLAARDEAGDVSLLPFVFTPARGLEERARRDRAPYAAWVKAGHLVALPGSTIELAQVAEFLAAKLAELEVEPTVFAYDRWRIDLFKTAALDANLSAPTWKEVGQGFKDMSPRLEAFESLLLANKLRHGGHPLLTMAAANAVAVTDPAGNRKLDKAKGTLRIDPLVAAVMAAFEVTEAGAANFDADAWIG